MKNRNFILETAQKSSIDEIRSKGVHTAKRGHEERGSEGGARYGRTINIHRYDRVRGGTQNESYLLGEQTLNVFANIRILYK